VSSGTSYLDVVYAYAVAGSGVTVVIDQIGAEAPAIAPARLAQRAKTEIMIFFIDGVSFSVFVSDWLFRE
jgi:hypothetical protein